jgi:hypothetical protein
MNDIHSISFHNITVTALEFNHKLNEYHDELIFKESQLRLEAKL